MRALQDEDTRKKEEEAEERKAMLDKIAEYERSIKITNTKASCIALGYPENLALEKAECIANGDYEGVLAVEKKFLDFHDKEQKEAAMRSMSRPNGATNTNGESKVTKADFDKFTYSEMVAFKTEHPEEYSEFIKK